MANKYDLKLILLLLVLLFGLPIPVKASYYSESHYNYCVYNWIDECPEVFIPGKGGDDEEPPITSISADIDDDGQQEYAVDQNRNSADGYEQFEDEDGSSVLHTALDGDGDGKIDFILITKPNGRPDKYWDPDDGVLGGVTETDTDGDPTLELLFDSDGNGTKDAYWDPDDNRVYRISANTKSRDIDQDGQPETAVNQDLDDTNGFELFIDDDGSSKLYAAIDGDGDGRTDFLITAGPEGLPDIYWDPDRDIVSGIALLNVDDDPSVEFLFDSTGDGTADKYYDRETSQVYDYHPPSETRFTPEGFGGAVYRELGNWLKSLPSAVIRALPLASLWFLMMLAGLFLLQARQELRRIESLRSFLQRQQKIAQEKKTFIQLISHYLRTPLTSIGGYSELMLSDTDRSLHQPAREVIEKTKGIKAVAETLISQADARTAQTIAGQTDEDGAKLSIWHRLFVVFPFIMFGLTVLAIQFALADFRLIAIPTWTLILLMTATALVMAAALVWIRRKSTRSLERKYRAAEVQAEEKMDDAVNQFVTEAAGSIGSSLSDLESAAGGLSAHKDYQKVNQSIDNLQSTIAKFSLLSQLSLVNMRRPETELFSAYEPIEQAIKDSSAVIQNKHLSINAEAIEFPSLDQNKNLVSFIISTVFDNAVSYSPENGRVDIHADFNETKDKVVLSFKDNGPGIPQDKQQLLFKPFSRTEGAEDFTHQGLGLSLHLDKLIARYLGGDINLISRQNSGTQVDVMLPIAL